VIKVSRAGNNIGCSRLCERCVLYVNNISNHSGISISKIIYSNTDGSFTKTSPFRLLNSSDHHISKYYKNHGYKPTLSCCSQDECCTEIDSNEDEDLLEG